MTSPIRRKAGAPSTRGRTALPVRTGYEPMIGCGISIEVASDRTGGVAFFIIQRAPPRQDRSRSDRARRRNPLATETPRTPGRHDRLRAEQPRWANVAAEPVADH